MGAHRLRMQSFLILGREVTILVHLRMQRVPCMDGRSKLTLVDLALVQIANLGGLAIDMRRLDQVVA